MAKNKVRKGTAVWVNEVGSIKNRPFKIIKENKENKTVLISFSINESYWIKKRNIRSKRVIIYKKTDEKIVAQNPDKWGLINLNKKGIKTLRFNLINQASQESKAAIYRWTAPKNTIDKLGPIFKLMFICIAIGVIGWSALKFGGMALDAITSSRIMSCDQLLPRIANPLGAVINITTPIGAV